jgi:hypothetical protein
MDNFRLVRSRIDVAPFLQALRAVDSAWDLQTGRQEKVRVQREALSVPLRGLRKSRLYGRPRRDVHESRWTSGSARFPLFRQFLEEVAASLDSELGRAKLVLLPSGRRVYPHIDRGLYYRLHERHHLVLKSTRGSWLRSGGETVRMREGELWWFDNRQVHEAHNDGDEGRIHLIFDLLPAQRRAEAARQRREARRLQAAGAVADRPRDMAAAPTMSLAR